MCIRIRHRNFPFLFIHWEYSAMDWGYDSTVFRQTQAINTPGSGRFCARFARLERRGDEGGKSAKRTGPSNDGPVFMGMPRRGVEPPSPCEHWHLKPACLPFHHLGAPNGLAGMTLRAFLPNYTGCGTILSRSERTYF